MSRDGKLRFDLRVAHRAGLGEMATALACAHRDHEIFEDGPLPGLSKAEVVITVKRMLHEGGTDFLEGWADHLTAAETESMWDWATEQIRSAFPELEPSTEGRK
ncbi:hypothetical protein ACFU6R_03070 [Streptomyces sp. NPDC057499]|uniref:hypothetical protein n=1 Tax=Streptomyces sp. NPDC057499 TaxID=3346150 RepID=UPI003695C168